ncbi:hydroxymethylglutaryl-CoA synthase [Marchantia polymorpha subsp. ruderalis]|uniref:Hydroxymethylglutaryl-CoA synthase n=2 Tax=Marchantia polymorpha TaxID=3197 RepID=A0AAF6BCQ0_MARPO|nr:hypothetical protein MARPO_0020s0034 [Marchantia polymorpha]BBN09784.1 hypothetical protein Mp_4g22640 [Marchantia polymorpha subsp. ruderalis]|eukprot:PTQ44366.1 hypothetical protein MARPO_0020s0034 [Marchantia polymorpha]
MACPRPENVGILAVEMYFPTSYVSQEELEVHDGVSKGKYTIGLGQDKLGFCTDCEDVISMSLTVVKSLMEKYGVSPNSIGRLEVGSETVIDKSKSIKTNLMELFEESGNGDVEGVDSTNACYGGTAALFNCINWVESTGWDGRFGLVVAADVAVYAEGPARPTGGAGAVAMLIGPNAPFVMERSYTSSQMSHAYDFYKPVLASEYPVVDGKLSTTCYLKALDLCYRRFCDKYSKKEGQPFSLADIDYVVCHSPYNKLVQKSFARLVYNDYLQSPNLVGEEVAAKLEPFAHLSHDDSLVNRDLEKLAQQVAKPQYDEKVGPTTLLPKVVGNMYCAALYGGLVTLIHNKAESLVGKRLVFFSYGSGLASSMFSFRVRAVESPFSLSAIAEALDITSKLESRIEVTPEKFGKAMHLGETRYGANDYIPTSSIKELRAGTFYLTKVDDKYRRFYSRKPSVESSPAMNGGLVA